MDIGERIQRIDANRHLQGLTIQQLADMCRLSPSTVSRTIAGKTEPTEYTVRAMEDALGITAAPDSDPVMDSLPDVVVCVVLIVCGVWLVNGPHPAKKPDASKDVPEDADFCEYHADEPDNAALLSSPAASENEAEDIRSDDQ